WKTDGNWAGPTYEQGQLNLLVQSEGADQVLELPQALFNSCFARPLGMPQPVVMHLMRRPMELAGVAKQARVASTFQALLSVLEESDDGLPRSALELQRWEDHEEQWWSTTRK
ncbi:unnamed protein product, partial [Polarella glacialis]